MTLQLHVTLLSDATFGRGDGVAGLIDHEVEHDVLGLPFLRGRTLKGLLVEECANIIYAVEKQQNPTAVSSLKKAAQALFGRAGSDIEDEAIMHVGQGLLPKDLRQAVAAEVTESSKPHKYNLTSALVLESLTALRRQTAVADDTGAPAETSLRSLRVVLRNTTFLSELDFSREPTEEELALLGACVLSLRRGGTGRNRGRGRLRAELRNEGNAQDLTAQHLARLKQIIGGVEAT